MEKYEQLKNLVEECENDFVKLYEKNVKAAAPRIRKIMQEIKVLAHEIRKDAQEHKTSISKDKEVAE